MKTRFLILVCLIFCCFISNAQQNVLVDSNNYYYYQGEKIYLSTRTDQMVVKLFTNANRNRLNEVVQTDTVIEPLQNFLTDTSNNFIIFEAKPNKIITSSTINKYKLSPDISCSSPLFNYDSSNVLQGLTDEFIIKLKPTSTISQLQDLVIQYNCILIEESEFEPNQFLISSSNSTYNALQLANIFYETNLFEYSTPNFIFTNMLQSNDEYYSNQWALNNTGQNGGVAGIDIKVEKAWTITEGSSNIHIAVVDDGVNLNHPDLFANILPGYDATGKGTGGDHYYSSEKHGTACAGIISAVKDNGIGISGIAPKCKIRPAHATFGTNNTTYWLSQSINWARNVGADVISNSWGGGAPNDAINEAINNAANKGRNNKGCVVIFASGNDNKNGVEYPSNLSKVIAVGAVDKCGIRSGRIDIVPNSCDPWCTNCKPGSSYGSGLYVVAPGTNVYSTDRQGNLGYYSSDYTHDFGGTSAACPHVAGVAALMLSINPEMTQQQVKYIISATAQKRLR